MEWNPPEFPYPVDAPVRLRAAAIRLVLFDVDGVLTDGRLYLDNQGEEYKAFHSRDGHGLKMIQAAGIEVGLLTGRQSKVVTHRAADLGIRLVLQGCNNKGAAFEALVKERELDPVTVAFVGDDVVDLPVMRRVGLAVAVQDAHYLVKQRAQWVTPNRGGLGAARDVCELLLSAQGHFADAFAEFLE